MTETISSTKLTSDKEIEDLYERLKQSLQQKKPLETIVGLVQLHPPIVERKDTQNVLPFSSQKCNGGFGILPG